MRGLAIPWTYFLHLPLSSVIPTDSSTESRVHVLMLSIQAVRGLPRLRAPGIVIVSKEKVARREIFMLAKRLSLERENERGWKSDTCRYTCPRLRTSPLVIVTANQILAPPSGPHPPHEVYETSQR